MKTKSKTNSGKRFSIELTTTQMCNFACEYCFENDCKVPDDNKISRNADVIIKSLKNLFDDEWYDDTFDTTQVTFWGGEPSLNMKFINKVVQALEYNENIGFYIYTNGTQIHKLLPVLLRFKDETIGERPRFSVQISYDGNPVHDMRRVYKGDGAPTSEDVLIAMRMLHVHGIPFSLKSTLAHKDFKYLPVIWDDMKALHDKYGTSYSLTVDYHNMEIYKYYDEMERALVDVSAKEYRFFKETNTFLSNIFTAKKKFCSAGKNMLTVDIDGNLYYCHGACYSKYPLDLQTGNIFEHTLANTVRYNYAKFHDTSRRVEECEQCVALTCLRCNVKKYEDSRESDFLDRWHDYPSQEELCLYYKTAGRIGRALIELLREE